MDSTTTTMMTAYMIDVAKSVYVRMTASDREACEKAKQRMETVEVGKETAEIVKKLVVTAEVGEEPVKTMGVETESMETSTNEESDGAAENLESVPALSVARNSSAWLSSSLAASQNESMEDNRPLEALVVNNVDVDSGSDMEQEAVPREEKYKADRRRSKTCQLCGDASVYRMTTHLKARKHQNVPEVIRPRLAEYMNIRGGMRDSSGKVKKVCPYPECGKFANNMKSHLMKYPHNFPDDEAAQKARQAIPVEKFDWASLISKYSLIKPLYSQVAAASVVVPSQQRVVDQPTTSSCEPRQVSASRSTAPVKAKSKTQMSVLRPISAENLTLLAEFKSFLQVNPCRKNSSEAELPKERYRATEQVSDMDEYPITHNTVSLQESFLQVHIDAYVSDKLSGCSTPNPLDSLLCKFINFLECKGKLDINTTSVEGTLIAQNGTKLSTKDPSCSLCSSCAPSTTSTTLKTSETVSSVEEVDEDHLDNTLGLLVDPENVIKEPGPTYSQLSAAVSEPPYYNLDPNLHMAAMQEEFNEADNMGQSEKSLRLACAKANQKMWLAALGLTAAMNTNHNNGTEALNTPLKCPAPACKQSNHPTKTPRREWTNWECLSFRRDFALEIETARESDKKTPLAAIRTRLQTLGFQWNNLRIYQIRDKIWTEAKGKRMSAKGYTGLSLP